jgi:ribosomal protein S1
MANATITMDDLLASAGDNIKQLVAGEVVHGSVLSVKKHEILIDLGPLGVGLVPRREVGFSKNYEKGDEVSASIAAVAILRLQTVCVGCGNREG